MEMMGIAGMILGRDDRAAAGWLELAALKERPTAMFLLSDMYARGRGRAVDGEAAMYWLQLAAESGSSDAMMRMSEVMMQVGDAAKVMNPISGCFVLRHMLVMDWP
jgi:TPR repeat protein